jgi:hypothetical protein
MKKHKMYCKDGKVHEVSSVKKHKALMKKGCGHKPLKGVNYKPKNTDDKKKQPPLKKSKYGFTYRTREERERKLVEYSNRIQGKGRGTAGGGNSGQQG